MNKKTLLLAGLAILILALAYGWYQYSRGHTDLASVKADFSLDASALHSAFAEDYEKASQEYVSKVIAVTGTVKSLQNNDQGIVVSLEGGPMGDVLCSLAEKDSKSLAEGQTATLTGECTGALGDADLGLLDVNLVRCVIK